MLHKLPEGIHLVNLAWYLEGMSRPTPPTYKSRNWPAYNEALKRRGSLTTWFDSTMAWEAVPTGKRAGGIMLGASAA
jgi:hypothetical protein